MLWNPANRVSHLGPTQLSCAATQALEQLTPFLHLVKCQTHSVAVKIKCNRVCKELCILPDT